METCSIFLLGPAELSSVSPQEGVRHLQQLDKRNDQEVAKVPRSLWRR